ncbi:NAD(P)H-quinone oxidoreductase [Paenibacillus sp. ACRRX]|uniref:NAD(P)H-quinone oxidoreductase n=1 Tax=unclassified Paenibacillus TaxID=185978 RepID=UPI001EF4CA82|nr:MULTISPECIES: NAD(P)H-quinone oxidoreductase [unclassified Paenibacillus]MCG7408559.1 NAD(P)H-quinone oxidoreductase [Paenibacillus sp. ACRRX]MDK8182807.1 NAD(P)H-quinone oxidoreductase [Paenibacillus sp. UMB4589-SE434]
MQTSMQACLIGSDHSLYWGDWEKPTCGPDELLVRIYATAVNRADLLQKRGKYPVPQGASPILGLEMAGTVEEVGANVVNWQVGERVAALLSGGGYAQYVVIPQAMAIQIPDQLSLEQAAGIPEVFLTAYLNAFKLGGLQAGERILVHAAASGVGTAAVQLAKAAGARVYATAGTDEKAEAVRRLGADCVMNYHHQSFKDRIQQETNEQGVQLILDPVGASYWKDNLDSLAFDGRLVLYGTLGGSKIESFDLMAAMLKRIHIMGSTLRGLPQTRKAALTADFVEWAMPMFKSGQLQPIIDSVWDAEEVNEAHVQMERNANIGKLIILTP